MVHYFNNLFIIIFKAFFYKGMSTRLADEHVNTLSEVTISNYTD